MNIEPEEALTEQKPASKLEQSTLLRTVVSLGLYIVVDYWIFKSWAAVFLLVSVIFIHESGHFIAMKIFGYKGIKMTFIPFVGAYVSGEATRFSKQKKLIMLLAGPIPGIIIGCILLYVYQQNFNNLFYWAALPFLLLNVFNLLPVSPLDGGQFFETLFFDTTRVIQLVFLYLSLAAVLYFAYIFSIYFLLLIALLLVVRIRSVSLIYKVRSVLDEMQIDYSCGYDDLTDEHYVQIRDVLINQSKFLSRKFTPGEPSDNEEHLSAYIKKVLLPSYENELTSTHKTMFLIVYLLAFLLPLLEWGFLKKWF